LVRRPNTVERGACQADPRELVYSAAAVDLPQLHAAALFGTLPPWLRDHSELAEFRGKCCVAQSENLQREFIAQRLLRAAQTPVHSELQLRDFA
jgi:hypothetical protein